MVSPKSEHLTNAQIADYVDGLLTPAERQRVEHHMQRCSVCRTEVPSQASCGRRIRRQRSRRQTRLRPYAEDRPVGIP